jgi:hypothetical protein
VNRIRYYVTVGEDDLLIHLSRMLFYNRTNKLLNFSSTVLIELHKIVLEGQSISDPSYYVNITINDEQINLPGAC